MENKNEKSESWMKEFAEFSEAEGISPPPILTERILSRVKADLNPDPLRLFGKIGVIQIFVGLFVAVLCPQFGLGLYESTRLMEFFMQFGHYTCMVACGGFFVGSTAVVSNIFLTTEELRVVRERKISYFATLSILSMGAFIALGGEVAFSFGMVWLLGALFGSIALFEIAWAARFQINRGFA
ncbi:MAG: hypothetical protein K2X47_14625 [Bdellovibrionales bacterium]|nr:hypothetical protein [Bdellovibrionales bacterium]